VLTKTSEAGLQVLLYLAASGVEAPVSPRALAVRLRLSPSYMAKVAAHLTRAGILRAHRGVHGGVTLNRPPEEIRLLDAVQALQGVILGSYCDSANTTTFCAFHRAMGELHEAIVGTLARWTLADLAASPATGAIGVNCRMRHVQAALANLRARTAAPGRPQRARRTP
jgi:Rrf2 family transcriptional regulator, nitric oxide-sensitive transcriptional repressor